MYEDEPQDRVHDVLAEAVFGDHPLGRRVIGSADVIGSIPVPDIDAYHRRRYVGPNIVVAAAGNLDHAHIVELAERHVSADTGDAGDLPGDTNGRTPTASFYQKDTEQYHICLGAPGIARTDERRFAGSILDAIVGGSASSRLFQEIREKRGLAYSVYSYSSHYSDSGQVGLYVGTRGENLATCLELAASELRDLATGNVRADELDRAKENLKGRLLLSLESTSTRMTRLGKATVTGTPLLSVEEIVKRLEAVTAEDVAALAGELLEPSRLSAAGIGPDETRFRDAVERVNPSLLAGAA